MGVDRLTLVLVLEIVGVVVGILSLGILLSWVYLAKRFRELVLDMQLMIAGVREVLQGSRAALQAARVLPTDIAGEPAPSTYPPRPSNPDVVALDRRKHDRRQPPGSHLWG